MRKLILFIASSLDGYIAGPDGEIDWLFHDQDYGYSAFYAGIDRVIMERKTYELSLSFGEYPYPGASAYVFSRTPRLCISYTYHIVLFIYNSCVNYVLCFKQAAQQPYKHL